MVIDLWAPWFGPTLVVLRDGTVVDRVVGAMPKPQLEAKIKRHLKPPEIQS